MDSSSPLFYFFTFFVSFHYFLNVTLMRIKGTKNKVKIDLNGKLIVWKDFKKGFSYLWSVQKKVQDCMIDLPKKELNHVATASFFLLPFKHDKTLNVFTDLFALFTIRVPFQVTCVALCEKFVIIIQNHQKWPWKPVHKNETFFNSLFFLASLVVRGERSRKIWTQLW